MSGPVGAPKMGAREAPRRATVCRIEAVQNPEAFHSLADWIGHIYRKVQTSVPPYLVRELEVRDIPVDLPGFFRMLDDWNRRLGERRLLVALDEYENLELKIGQGVFPQDLSATLREAIQQHRQITWLFAGSHQIDELTSVNWTSYLISARTLEIPCFTPNETHLLLTEPMKASVFWRDKPNRPRMDPSSWGEDGIAQIHRETAGWPHLVQLVAETLVDLFNDQDGQRLDNALFEEGLQEAVGRGYSAFYELLVSECQEEEEWQFLRSLALESQPFPKTKSARSCATVNSTSRKETRSIFACL